MPEDRATWIDNPHHTEAGLPAIRRNVSQVAETVYCCFNVSVDVTDARYFVRRGLDQSVV